MDALVDFSKNLTPNNTRHPLVNTPTSSLMPTTSLQQRMGGQCCVSSSPGCDPVMGDKRAKQ